MAVPTFTAVSPAEGLTQGLFLVAIDGSGFRLPPDPPADGFVGGTFLRTVRVEIGAEQALDVRVLTDGKLTCLIPPYRGNADVETIAAQDITITNLDDDGDPIGGETVTAVDAWQYYRPPLDSESDFTRLNREILRTLKRAIHPNTTLTTHTDYDDTTGDLLNIVALSELPGLVIMGPDLLNNRFYSRNRLEFEPTGPREFERDQSPRTVDLQFTLIGAAEEKTTLLNLMAAAEGFFEATKWIYLDRDPSDLAQGRVKYELVLTADFEAANIPNTSNVRQFTGTFIVRAFDVELGAVEQGYLVDDGDGEATLDTEGIET